MLKLRTEGKAGREERAYSTRMAVARMLLAQQGGGGEGNEKARLTRIALIGFARPWRV